MDIPDDPRMPIVIEHIEDIVPALAWATRLSLGEVKATFDRLKLHGYTSRQIFEHFVGLAREQGCVLTMATGDRDPS
jgi:hypothetical protein